ncbi:MAG: creatininase family protein [Chloroflexota bacterium]
MTDARTDIFQYENLTWPEVAALPRDVPLVIPLGKGYDLSRLCQMLGNPSRLGLLPSIPYGWMGSGLDVSSAAFAPLAKNLLDSLRDDGFSRVLLLSPPGVDLGLGKSAVTLEKQAEPDVSASFKPSLVVLIPIGHTEQHGHHLPLSTDSLIIDAIAQGTTAAIPDQAAALPVMPYGVSTHRRAFAGTLNAGGRAFEDFYLAVIDALVARGFDRIYLMSGHGGNCSFLTTIVKYAGERHRRAFIATAWLYLSSPDGIAALYELRRSKIGGMGHACELETSLILHLRPELVHMDRVIDETDFVTSPSYYMDWIEGGALVANPPWDDDTQTGAYGAGSLATAEHGRLWREASIAEKVAHVREIDEQHRRREERRSTGYGLWGHS